MKVLNKEFWSFCEWLIDNKLSIRFRVDKTKTNYFILKKNPAKTSVFHTEIPLENNTILLTISVVILILRLL